MCQNLGNISFIRFCSFESDLCSWRSLTFLEPEIEESPEVLEHRDHEELLNEQLRVENGDVSGSAKI